VTADGAARGWERGSPRALHSPAYASLHGGLATVRFTVFWLVPHETGLDEDFEALCLEFPVRAVRLRELRAHWDRLEAMQVVGAGVELPEEPGAPRGMLGRFLEEAQISAQLDHPGIVPVHELGLDAAGFAYFTMKRVRGTTLKEVFAELALGAGGWTETRVLSLILKVCEAMAYAHDKGVIHRDLKPANVMVGKYGEVYVMDWGVAKTRGRSDRRDLRVRADVESGEGAASGARGESEPAHEAPLVTMDGHVLGTPAYMSPEQAAGRVQEMGPQSDVYAVGAMLYQLLAGQAPYLPPGVRLAPFAVLQQVQRGPPRPLRELAPHAQAELVAICERAMARQPKERYADMSALSEDLSAYLEGRVVGAYETGAWAESRKWIKRNPALAASLTAGVLLAFAGLGSVGYVQARGRRAANAEAARADEEARRASARAEDVLRLSALQDLQDLLARADELWPPYPEKIEAFRDWIRDAEQLEAALPDHREKREELRREALPRSEEQRLAEAKEHPDYPELVALRGSLLAKRRALAQRRDGLAEPLPAVNFAQEPEEPAVLNDQAWQLVDPERTVFGEEPRGLVLAQRALELTPEGAPLRASIGDTLAWACFALGRDAEALAAERAALAAAPEGRQTIFKRGLERLEQAVAAASSPEGLQAAEAELPRLAAEAAALEARVSERRDWLFPPEHENARWWQNQLSRLIEGLEALRQPQGGLLTPEGISEEHGWSLPKRLGFAERLRDGFAPAGDHARGWAKALPALRAAYPEFELAPQMGLVPLGPDPDSHLAEFAHLATGEPAVRGADGRLVLREDTGVVLVLLHGRKFWMGAQSQSPAGPNFDPEPPPRQEGARELSVSPFLVSKYELTQGQWLRLAGRNPSLYGTPGQNKWRDDWLASGAPPSLLHPVENVSWSECLQCLRRAGLVLPTEGQWEYAARGGTQTPWWTGAGERSLEGAANLLDRYSIAHTDLDRPGYEDWLDDGAAWHARVGSYEPNPFGLHDVAGNVWEWCLDTRGPTGGPRLDPDADLAEALRLVQRGEKFNRVARGGSFHYDAEFARATWRSDISSAVAIYDVGVRPAMSLRD
jgi:formylglycine-generating enzyme required for sulfatase activity/serine/threonine protein kinase